MRDKIIGGASRAKQLTKKSWARITAAIIAAVVIFAFGVSVGSGALEPSWTRSTQNSGLPEDLDYSSVEELYDQLRTTYDGDLSLEALMDGLKYGLVEASGDRYTVYMNSDEAKAFSADLSGTFSGIGAELGTDDNKSIIIVTPIAGFPAEKAGLRPQDLIAEINGESTSGMNITDAVSKIRGEKGTQVTLRIIRDKTQDLSFTITRDSIKIPSVDWEILEGNIGYMKITQFNEETAGLADQAAREFKSKGVKGVVLDLRGNPGGLLDASVAVSSLWLPKGATVLQEKRSGVVVETETASGNNVLQGMPTAVLINAGSASAAEIVAGALKDNNVATLFGVKSFGKGSVQQIKEVGDGELKVTIARWHRPNGENIDKQGISPGTEVKMTEEDYTAKRDPQKDAAVNSLK